jgi:hypothetical protein
VVQIVSVYSLFLGLLWPGTVCPLM